MPNVMSNWTEWYLNAMGNNLRWGEPMERPVPDENRIRFSEDGQTVYPPRLFGRLSVEMIPFEWMMDHCAFAKEKNRDCPRKSDSSINCCSCPIRPENKPRRRVRK